MAPATPVSPRTQLFKGFEDELNIIEKYYSELQMLLPSLRRNVEEGRGTSPTLLSLYEEEVKITQESVEKLRDVVASLRQKMAEEDCKTETSTPTNILASNATRGLDAAVTPEVKLEVDDSYPIPSPTFSLYKETGYPGIHILRSPIATSPHRNHALQTNKYPNDSEIKTEAGLETPVTVDSLALLDGTVQRQVKSEPEDEEEDSVPIQESGQQDNVSSLRQEIAEEDCKTEIGTPTNILASCAIRALDTAVTPEVKLEVDDSYPIPSPTFSAIDSMYKESGYPGIRILRSPTATSPHRDHALQTDKSPNDSGIKTEAEIGTPTNILASNATRALDTAVTPEVKLEIDDSYQTPLPKFYAIDSIYEESGYPGIRILRTPTATSPNRDHALPTNKSPNDSGIKTEAGLETPVTVNSLVLPDDTVLRQVKSEPEDEEEDSVPIQESGQQDIVSSLRQIMAEEDCKTEIGTPTNILASCANRGLDAAVTPEVKLEVDDSYPIPSPTFPANDTMYKESGYPGIRILRSPMATSPHRNHALQTDKSPNDSGIKTEAELETPVIVDSLALPNDTMQEEVESESEDEEEYSVPIRKPCQFVNPRKRLAGDSPSSDRSPKWEPFKDDDYLEMLREF